MMCTLNDPVSHTYKNFKNYVSIYKETLQQVQM